MDESSEPSIETSFETESIDLSGSDPSEIDSAAMGAI
jgi:hypothetical protein